MARDFRKAREAQHQQRLGTEELSTGRVLACGHEAKGEPQIARPAQWWCCGSWQKAKR